jgi:hypothetical protein
MHTQAQAHSMQTLTHPDNGGGEGVDGGHGAGIVHRPPLAATCILLGKRCLDDRRRMLLCSALAILGAEAPSLSLREPACNCTGVLAVVSALKRGISFVVEDDVLTQAPLLKSQRRSRHLQGRQAGCFRRGAQRCGVCACQNLCTLCLCLWVQDHIVNAAGEPVALHAQTGASIGPAVTPCIT